MKKPLVLLTTIPLVALLAACGADVKNDGKTSVVASFYPFAYVAEQVGGPFVTVQNLTSPGAEPHDLELKPKQVAAVQDADLVIFEKHFQAAVDAAVKQADRPKEGTVDADIELSVLPTQEGADEEGHDHSSEDPHTWLDPHNMIVMAKAISTKLAAADPDHASDYRTNADALITKLGALDQAFDVGLKNCAQRTIVTSHAAFQYLAERYGLTQVPIAGIDPSNEPSPSQLADISDLVRKKGITTVFTEELVSPAIARTIARETGTSVATLDPIEGLSADTKGETYLTLMEKNLTTLKKANSCT